VYGEILAALNIVAWALCFALYIKGHVAPSSSDSGSTGNILQDFYWGMELYRKYQALSDRQVHSESFT
jgi:7-dehydrocholesterol reductase